VLRLFHRAHRDKRVTSHLVLAARALGARGLFFCGQYDKSIMETIEKVNDMWGGDFKVVYIQDYIKLIKSWKKENGEVIHLTMYGIPVTKVIDDVRKSRKKKLIVVGGEKVPGIIYKLADWNISVTNQPHSEISALAIFLHELFKGEELNLEFRNAKMRIIPQAKGKKVIRLNDC
ncbi:tRNA (cytidine(56)-2'-O)-methyltransferase, partial [Candidatus Geothermarchaeota archaeon]